MNNTARVKFFIKGLYLVSMLVPAAVLADLKSDLGIAMQRQDLNMLNVLKRSLNQHPIESIVEQALIEAPDQLATIIASAVYLQPDSTTNIIDTALKNNHDFSAVVNAAFTMAPASDVTLLVTNIIQKASTEQLPILLSVALNAAPPNQKVGLKTLASLLFEDGIQLTEKQSQVKSKILHNAADITKTGITNADLAETSLVEINLEEINLEALSEKINPPTSPADFKPVIFSFEQALKQSMNSENSAFSNNTATSTLADLTLQLIAEPPLAGSDDSAVLGASDESIDDIASGS
ncbi:MAG: hypothetical protein KUG79_18625 [Pseudomonadales bacterium]|nr:hypothetical protein [Pseudomonadales bacterium]